MSKANGSRLEEIFHGALDRSESLRLAFLDQACAGDEVLRAQVERLLGRDEQAIQENFLAAPVVGTVLDGTSFSESGHPLMGRQIGPYVIQDAIGSGGMGTVYLAERVGAYRQRVVIKVIKEGFEREEFLRRFRNERQVLARLSHPNIARLLDGGATEDGAPYFVMEYVDGKPLDAHYRTWNLDQRQRLGLLGTLCSAVHYAHQQMVIHRDLKPANILVDREGQPKILDFGVARITDADLRTTTVQTEAGRLIGTLTYMSPEQATGEPGNVDVRSDVYALGVIGYELLSGQLPYDLRGRSIPEAVRVICEVDAPRLGSINRTCRGDIETIVSRALEKDKARRYQSASDLAADIQRYLENKPIEARPPSTRYQLRKFAQRNRGLVAGMVAALVTLVVATGVSLSFARQAILASRESKERFRKYQEATLSQLLDRGAWQEALKQLDEVIAADPEGNVALRVQRLKVLNALDQHERLNKELSELERVGNVGQFEGELLLWRADQGILRGGDLDQTVTQIKDSLSKGLPPAETDYANGLLASDAPSAVQRFERAIELNRYLQRAHYHLCLTLFLLGRSSEARLRLAVAEVLFPDDAHFAILHAMIQAHQNPDGASEALARAKSHMNERHWQIAQATAGLLSTLSQLISSQDFTTTKHSSLSLLGSFKGKLIGLGRNINAIQAALDMNRIGQVQQQLALPPFLAKGIGHLLEGAKLSLMGNNGLACKKLELAAKAHPEGVVLLVYAGALSHCGRREDAIETLRRAVSVPSIVEIRRAGLLALIAHEAEAAYPKSGNINAAMQRHSLESIRRYLALFRPSVTEAYHLAMVAWRGDDYTLARSIVVCGEEQSPDDFLLKLMGARIAFSAGDCQHALDNTRNYFRLRSEQKHLPFKNKIGGALASLCHGPLNLVAATYLPTERNDNEAAVIRELCCQAIRAEAMLNDGNFQGALSESEIALHRRPSFSRAQKIRDLALSGLKTRNE